MQFVALSVIKNNTMKLKFLQIRIEKNKPKGPRAQWTCLSLHQKGKKHIIKCTNLIEKVGHNICQCKRVHKCIEFTALPRHNTENSKQIFPEKDLHGLISNFHIHVSVSNLYIPTIGVPNLLQENMWTDPGNV